MTMLTQSGGSFQLSSRASADRPTLAAGDHPTISRICRFVLTVLLMGGVLAATIALKTLAFVWRLHA